MSRPVPVFSIQRVQGGSDGGNGKLSLCVFRGQVKDETVADIALQKKSFDISAEAFDCIMVGDTGFEPVTSSV